MDYIRALADAQLILLTPEFGAHMPDYRAMACRNSWSQIPDYGPARALFDQIPDRQPWFGIFSLSYGFILQFHYPKAVQNGKRIVVTYNADRVIPSGSIEWTHGASGLAEGKCFDIMVFWVGALVKRRTNSLSDLNIILKGL